MKVHIVSADILGQDTFFKIVGTTDDNKDSITFDTVSNETLYNIVQKLKNAVTFDPDFRLEDGTTLEELIQRADLSYSEISDFETDDEYDVYYHKVSTSSGKIVVDTEGEFIKSYKTIRGARSKANELANNVVDATL